MLENIIPCFTLIILYSGIIQKIRKMRNQFNEVLQRQQSVDFEEEWKMIKMMLIIIITFIVTTAPFRYIYNGFFTVLLISPN